MARADLVEEATLLASDLAGSDELGTSVSIDGNTAVAGSPSAGSPSDSGAAYVFEKNASGWQQIAKLKASNAAIADRFGDSVFISGDTIVVGATAGDSPTVVNSGAAYVYVRPPGGWADMTESALLTASDANKSHNFGNAVSIDGETVVVGDVSHQGAGFLSGAAYVFVRPVGGWQSTTENARLWASNGEWYDRFGTSVAVSGDTIAVGSSTDNSAAVPDSGTVFVFDRPAPGWANTTETVQLAASDAAKGDEFGVSVALDGDSLLVGAKLDDDACPSNDLCDSGSAYVYSRTGSTWSEQAKLTASNASTKQCFGWSVALSGDRAVVGAPGNNVSAAYVFDRVGSTWSETAHLAAYAPTSFDAFGFSVAADGSRVVVGANEHDGLTINATGAAFVFGPDGQWADLGQGLAGAMGVPVLVGKGAVTEGTTVGLVLSGTLGSALGILVVGTSAVPTPFLGGTLVPQPNLVAPVVTNSSGGLTLFGSWPAGVPSVSSFFFQVWVADPFGPANAAASNSVAVTTP